MAAKMSVLGLIRSSYPHLRSAMVQFPLSKKSKKKLKSKKNPKHQRMSKDLKNLKNLKIYKKKKGLQSKRKLKLEYLENLN